MLTPSQFDAIAGPVVELYVKFAQTIINEMARKLGTMELSSTTAWQMQRLIESGMSYQQVIDELSRLTGLSEKVLQDAFRKAGVTALKFDDSVYKAAGLKPIPLHLSPAMLQVLQAGLSKAQGVIRNLTMTTATTTQQAFIEALDIAYLQVSSGTMSYTEAIRYAIKGIGKSGLEVVYPSGHRDKLDVAIRRALLTGIGQTTNELQWMRADEMGQDLVETSAHNGARPTHQIWQGHIFSRSGTHPKYPPFKESTNYGEIDGLGGINCRHSYYPFFEGISEAFYNQAMRDELNNETVTYNGKEYSAYDASQIQRSIERKIREWKRQAEALDSAGIDNAFELGKV